MSDDPNIPREEQLAVAKTLEFLAAKGASLEAMEAWYLRHYGLELKRCPPKGWR